MPEFIVYHHKALPLANYVIDCCPTLAAEDAKGNVSRVSLPQHSSHAGFAELPRALRRLLFFARPDTVICLNDGIRPTHPIFAFELTDHVPAQDHWMQRFNNLVGAAQERVPGAYILPFAMPLHPKFKGQLDHVFFYAYDRVTEIHQTPIFIAEWETVGGHTTKNDQVYHALPDRRSPDLVLTFRFLEHVIDSAIHGRPVTDLFRERLIVDLRNRIRSKAYSKIPQIQDFQRLAFNMPNNKMLTTADLVGWLQAKGHSLPQNLPDRFRKRDRNLIFVPQVQRRGKTLADLRTDLMSRIDIKGGDPYLGQPLAFDYIFCRLGETPYERDANLILDLSVLEFADLATYHRKVWQSSELQHTKISQIKHIPTYTMELKEGAAQLLKNVLRIYAFAADMIVYRDGLIYF